jgi:hypothetical protein
MLFELEQTGAGHSMAAGSRLVNFVNASNLHHLGYLSSYVDLYVRTVTTPSTRASTEAYPSTMCCH